MSTLLLPNFDNPVFGEVRRQPPGGSGKGKLKLRASKPAKRAASKRAGAGRRPELSRSRR